MRVAGQSLPQAPVGPDISTSLPNHQTSIVSRQLNAKPLQHQAPRMQSGLRSAVCANGPPPPFHVIGY